MEDHFKLWWEKQPDPGDDRAREAAAAVWNDARQMLLASIVFKLSADRKKALELMGTYKPGSELRLQAAGIVNYLGKLVVSISEMNV